MSFFGDFSKGFGGVFKNTGQFLFGKEGKSRPAIDPAIMSREQISEAISRLMGMKEWGTPAQTQFSSPYETELSNVMSRGYSPTSAENDLLNNIMNRTSAQFASRGLGSSPIAASATASSIAPTLAELRSKYFDQLTNLRGQDINRMGLGIQQRGQDIESMLQQRTLLSNALLNLLQVGGRRQNVGTVQNQGTPGFLGTLKDMTQSFINLKGGRIT